MSDQRLRSLLEQLQAELARAEDLPEEQRQSLRRLADELRSLLARPAGARGSDQESVRERLDDWVRELEASHPALSITLSNLIETLAFFGL
jgi:DNA repair exonuclease SbcCD ATPase subunit